MTLLVVDTSDFNSDFSLGDVRNYGVVGLTNKLGEGGVANFVHNYTPRVQGAKNSGYLFYGVYYVPRTNTGVSVDGQVQDLVSRLNGSFPDWRTDPKFVVQVDLELWQYDAVPWDVGVQFARGVVAAGKKPLLYASEGQYGNRTTEFPQWNADYHDDAYGDPRNLYQRYGGDQSVSWAGGAYTFWQFTQHGQISNYTGDVSAFRGDESQLQATLGGSTSGYSWYDDSEG